MNVSHMTKVKDANEQAPADGCRLWRIFWTQGQLREAYQKIERSQGFDCPDVPGPLDDAKFQAHLKDLAFRCVTELVEAMECLKNKPWKLSQVPTDVDHYYEELADALHFFVELCSASGLDAGTLYQYYMAKAGVNQWRQATKY